MRGRMTIALLALGMGMWHAPLSSELKAAERTEAAAPHRVVMHLNSGEEKIQLGALHNVRHLYQAVGREQLRVEFVVHGAGLSLLTKGKTTLEPELIQLQQEYGVAYTACSNTMKAMRLTREDLIDAVGDTVPAMVRLMERQEQGWSYIKP